MKDPLSTEKEVVSIWEYRITMLAAYCWGVVIGYWIWGSK